MIRHNSRQSSDEANTERLRAPVFARKNETDRLLDIIHGLLNEHDNTMEHDDFEVFLSGQRREETTSVDEVLKLDNSRKSDSNAC